jgi:hypothetical protein
MLKAYVGVASQQGLSIFQPERDDTLSLVRRSVRRGLRRFAFWAIVNDAEAQSIQALFLDGHRREALIALNRCVTHCGPILPGDTDHSLLH